MIHPTQERLAEEGPEKGLYLVAHRFEKSGKYDLTVGAPGWRAENFSYGIHDHYRSDQSGYFRSSGKVQWLHTPSHARRRCHGRMVIMMGVIGALILL